jgi:hypothetical protein
MSYELRILTAIVSVLFPQVRLLSIRLLNPSLLSLWTRTHGLFMLYAQLTSQWGCQWFATIVLPFLYRQRCMVMDKWITVLLERTKVCVWSLRSVRYLCLDFRQRNSYRHRHQISTVKSQKSLVSCLASMQSQSYFPAPFYSTSAPLFPQQFHNRFARPNPLMGIQSSSVSVFLRPYLSKASLPFFTSLSWVNGLGLRMFPRMYFVVVRGRQGSCGKSWIEPSRLIAHYIEVIQLSFVNTDSPSILNLWPSLSIRIQVLVLWSNLYD